MKNEMIEQESLNDFELSVKIWQKIDLQAWKYKETIKVSLFDYFIFICII